MKTRLPLIVLMNLAGLALFFSWLLLPVHGFWFPVDAGVFRFFNNLLTENRAFLWLVAITNNRAFDGCSLVAMGLLMLSYWVKETPYGRRHGRCHVADRGRVESAWTNDPGAAP